MKPVPGLHRLALRCGGGAVCVPWKDFQIHRRAGGFENPSMERKQRHRRSAEQDDEDPAQASFLAAFKADLARPLPFEEPLPLTTTLPGFGREVPGATGEIWYHDSFPGGLVIGVTLAGLVPNHKYILTINGAIQHAGNNNLPEQLTRNNPQK